MPSATSRSAFTVPVLLDTLRHTLMLDKNDPIHNVGTAPLSIIASRPDAVTRLAHERLHVYPYKDVPVCWRRLYEEACLWNVVETLNLLLVIEQREIVHNEKGGAGGQGVQGMARSGDEERNDMDWRREVIRLCDSALILTGAPGRRDVIDMILAAVDDEEENDLHPPDQIYDNSEEDELEVEPYHKRPENNWDTVRSAKRRRLAHSKCSKTPVDAGPTTFPISHRTSIPHLDHPIERLSSASLTTFRNHMHDKATPMILTNTIDHWPALRRWKDPRYWLRRTHGGKRLVPIEVGKSYTDEGWAQKIIEFGKFLEDYLTLVPDEDREEQDNTISDQELERRVGNSTAALQPSREGKSRVRHLRPDTQTGYLAQHDLLTQIPALRNDIAIPDYCYIEPPVVKTLSSTDTIPRSISPSPKPLPPQPVDLPSPSSFVSTPSPPTTPLLNIWLGPSHTTSPAHTDPHHNILSQVLGRKYIRLFAPSETPALYPMSYSPSLSTISTPSESPEINMANTSRVDISAFLPGADPAAFAQEAAKYPLHVRAKYVEAVLEPGECLYIPRGWWHYVTSLEVSCSVSFWWD